MNHAKDVNVQGSKYTELVYEKRSNKLVLFRSLSEDWEPETREWNSAFYLAMTCMPCEEHPDSRFYLRHINAAWLDYNVYLT